MSELKNQELPLLVQWNVDGTWVVAAHTAHELRDKLLAAVNELKAAESKWDYANKVVQNQYAELAAKDARIADLENWCSRSMSLESFNEILDALKIDRAKLRAVSEVLKEKLPRTIYTIDPSYLKESVDNLLARLRSIVEGNTPKESL